MRYSHRHDENGFLIVQDNSERCRNDGEDNQNIWYQDVDEDGKTTAAYALCRNCDPERKPAASDTVTVHRNGQRYTSEFSKLPGQSFGPWDFSEMVRDLTVSALLPPLEARNLVLDAFEKGKATAQTQ